MARVIILGCAYSIPDEKHENTHFVILGQKRGVLVDCAGNPVVRLRKAGVNFDQLTDIVLTHFHPDHVSGVPLLLMDLWLMGRKQPLNVYGLQHTVERMETLMRFYDWEHWPNFFPVAFHALPDQPMTQVFADDEMSLYASPVHHLIPTIGLRIEFPLTQKSMAYSCDTEPCAEVAELASGVDVLMHEATGLSIGHTSPAQAGEMAHQAQARSLYLIHYPSGDFLPETWLEAARSAYEGPVMLAEDFMELDL